MPVFKSASMLHLKTKITDLDFTGSDPVVVMDWSAGIYIDAFNLVSSPVVATGSMEFDLWNGSRTKLLASSFFQAAALTSAISTDTDIMKISTALADAAGVNTDLRLKTTKQVLEWIFLNKTSGHSITAEDLRANSYNVVARMKTGTLASGDEIYFSSKITEGS